MKHWVIKKSEKYLRPNGSFSSLSNAQVFSSKTEARGNLYEPKETGEHLVQVEIKEIESEV